jgi:hypothetical protein
MYMPSFVNIGSGVYKLIRVVKQTHRQHGDCISLLSFYLNKESEL